MQGSLQREWTCWGPAQRSVKGPGRECGHPRLQPYLGSNRTLSAAPLIGGGYTEPTAKAKLIWLPLYSGFQTAFHVFSATKWQRHSSPRMQNNHGAVPEEKNVSWFPAPCAPPGKYAVARRHWPSGEKQQEENREHPCPRVRPLCDSEHVQFWRLPLHVTNGIPHYRVQ